jgi:hypothetical protein
VVGAGLGMLGAGGLGLTTGMLIGGAMGKKEEGRRLQEQY